MNFNVAGIVDPECQAITGVTDQYAVRIFEAGIVLPSLCLVILIVNLCQTFSDTADMEDEQPASFNAWLAAFTITHLVLVRNGVNALNCVQLSDGRSVLAARHAIVCSEDSGYFMKIGAPGFFLLVVFGFLVPAVIFMILYTKDRRDKLVQRKCGWFCQRYRPAVWWYEFVIQGQRTAIIFISILLGSPGTASSLATVVENTQRAETTAVSRTAETNAKKARKLRDHVPVADLAHLPVFFVRRGHHIAFGDAACNIGAGRAGPFCRCDACGPVLQGPAIQGSHQNKEAKYWSAAKHQIHNSQ